MDVYYATLREGLKSCSRAGDLSRSRSPFDFFGFVSGRRPKAPYAGPGTGGGPGPDEGMNAKQGEWRIAEEA